MQIFLLTFLILGLAIIGMAVGVILNRRELKGSCGGISSIPGMEDHNSNCSCSKPCDKRKARIKQEQQSLKGIIITTK